MLAAGRAFSCLCSLYEQTQPHRYKSEAFVCLRRNLSDEGHTLIPSHSNLGAMGHFMGQVIVFVIVVFTIACIYYGIAAGVQAIGRGAAHLTGGAHQRPQNPNKSSNTTLPSAVELTSAQRCVGELQKIYALRQSGGLSPSEFEELKCMLLGDLSRSNRPSKQG